MSPQAILYIIAVILLALAAFISTERVKLLALGLAFAVLAYAWPVIAHG